MPDHRPSAYAVYCTDSDSTVLNADAFNDGNSDHPAPAFPPELERQVFEICALSRPVFIPTLMLVAWRVKEWVEPLLYRTMALDFTRPMDGFPVFTTEILLTAIGRKPPSFFREAVRNLLILTHISIDVLKVVLPVCTGVQNLCVEFLDAEMVPLFAPLVLDHLYIKQDPFRVLSPLHPLFSQITHVEMVFSRDDAQMWTAFTLLPRLTHLCFSRHDENLVPISLRLLESCKFLLVLVVIVFTPLPLEVSASLSQDLRFLTMPLRYYGKDWQMGVHSGNDYWSRAESFIAKRRMNDESTESIHVVL
ncbi:hypothetical protein FB451DRAFT_1405086 [Mycena latifolia]|nr:hypothetical protein FB451DRAFT_1405086 [Mycena latifolia]